MGVSMGGHRLGPGQTKVRQLQLSVPRDQQILRLDITVEDPPLVTEGQSPQQLEHEELDVPGREAPRVILQVLGQVCVQILEHEGQAGLGVDDVMQSHDVDVSQLLQKTRLPDGSEGSPLFLLKSDLLKLFQCLRTKIDSHSSSAA